MLSGLERRALSTAIAVFVTVLIAGAAVDAHLVRLDVEARRRAAADLALASGFAIEQEFARSLSSASTLAAMVAAGASERQLDGVAQRMLALNGATGNLQLARDFVISHLWPLSGNEAARGLDVRHAPLHADQVRRLVETRSPVLYGPFELVQGGVGFALRVPVLVGRAGEERVWGLSSAVVRTDALLAESRIPRLVEAGFDYEISRGDAGARPGEVLASRRADGAPLRQPVTVPIHLPDQTWTLAVAPRAGWSPGAPRRVAHAAALLIALLAGVLAYRVLSLPEILRREVAARTAELEIAHREQRRAEEAQRQSQKLEAIGLLAGGVAHDFNNLLVGILGYADLLAGEATPGSITEEAAKTIAQAGKRAAELTRQLLAFARLGNQRQERVDLHALVREVVALLGRTLDKSIRTEACLQAPLHHVRGDAGQLEQVIVNLAVNARDAMPEGGKLTYETAVEDVLASAAPPGLAAGRYVVLSVSDTGVGIPPEHLERIFDPFFTTKAEGRGSGLGLATAYGIVKAHGGAVRVWSEVGSGSRFTVHLPAIAEGAPAIAEPGCPTPRGSGRVLVVDDEESVRRTAGRILESLGFEPVLAESGPDALDRIGAAPAPVAVILDLVMPGMDGRSCFRELRARHPGIPVIVSSGFSRNGRAQDLLDDGAAAFLQKPYEVAELACALHAAIGGGGEVARAT